MLHEKFGVIYKMKSIIVLFEVKSVKREKERGFDLASMFEPLLTGGRACP